MFSSLVTQGTLAIKIRKLEAMTQVYVCPYLGSSKLGIILFSNSDWQAISGNKWRKYAIFSLPTAI